MSGRYKPHFGGFVLTSILLVGVGLMGLLDSLSVLSGDSVYYGETFIVLAMLQAAAE